MSRVVPDVGAEDADAIRRGIDLEAARDRSRLIA